MVAIATDQRPTGEISEEERELRIQLAAAYRLADKYGMSELIHPHLSARPGVDANVSAQPPRHALPRDHRFKPGEDRLRRQRRGAERVAGESGGRRDPWVDPIGAPGH